MKISIDWLNQYLDRPADADEVEHLLTQQGLPIEARESIAPDHDTVLDVEVTNNRSDCLSHLGLAREVAAGSGRRLIIPDDHEQSVESVAQPPDTGIESIVSVVNDSPDLCSLYTARVIKGVKVGPSPPWLVRRLESLGLRSVNNVVDVTNFVLLEWGQPLHAFDLAKLDGPGIVVRTAAAGEPFVAIDGTSHKLDQDTLIISDARRPVAVAGVMGGVDSEVSSMTTDLLLESAIFDPLTVRRTSRRLKLSSDSSYRFERGVDPNGVEAASRRAVGLILDLAGGTLIPGVTRVGINPPKPVQVTMRPDRCRQLLGIDLPTNSMQTLLDRLDLNPRLDRDHQDGIICSIPTYRLDLQREVDIIEEVARLQGFDAIPVAETIHITAQPVQPAIAMRQTLNQALAAHGYHETITLSFLHPQLGEPFVPEGETAVLVHEDCRTSDAMLRPSVLPSLLLCRKANQDRGNSQARLYEVAATWTQYSDRVIERRSLALLLDAPDAQHALRDARSTVEEAARCLVGQNTDLPLTVDQKPHHVASAKIMLDEQPLGSIGLIKPSIQKQFNLQTPVVTAELNLDLLLQHDLGRHEVQALPRFPGIERDLSVIIPDKVAWAQVESVILESEPALMESLWFLNTYRGKPIPVGFKAIALRMLFRDPSTTLRREQADIQVQAVFDQLRKRLDAKLRE